MKKEIGKEGKTTVLILLLIFILTLMTSVIVSAGLIEDIKAKISGKAVSTVAVNVTVGKPEIRFVYNNTSPSITSAGTGLNSGPSSTVIIINFSVFHASGVVNMNNETAAINISFQDRTVSRSNSSACLQYQVGTNTANYTCNVTMWWFDTNGAWFINASISDTSGNSGSNSSANFSVGETIGAQLSSLTWPGLSPGQTNKTEDKALKVNNTGNKAIPINATQINATNLKGETTTTQAIWSKNISVSWDLTSLESCDISGGDGIRANNLSNQSYVNVTVANLTRGNYTVDNNATGQEVYYFCIRTVGAELSAQSYSTAGEGPWQYQILFAPLAYAGYRRKKKVKKLIENLSIPSTIFSNKLGALESLVKYLKENLEMNYSEIARILNRDDRTIWTAYKKSNEKQSEIMKPEKTKIFLPISILENRKLTVLESAVVYLKEKGLKYSEIAKLLEREQRNIWTIYSNAVKKINKKEKIDLKKQKGELTIPSTIFSNKLGALESLVKYLKENLEMNYSEIARLLNRDDRTIWTAYKKSNEKQSEIMKPEKTKIFLPISILENRKLTILESAVVYLKEKGLKYSEIAKLLERNNSNIWNNYSKAIEKK